MKHDIEHNDDVRIWSRGQLDGGFLSRFLTFRNIVIVLGIVVLLIVMAHTVSVRIALLFLALAALGALGLFEISNRRKWQSELLESMARMNEDYERLVRDVARSRNEVASLKKTLADVGIAAKSHGKVTDTEAERRMVRAIADQLSRLNDPEPVPEKETQQAEKEIAQELVAVRPVDDLTDEEIIRMVRAAVREDRIDLFLQPIVSLPQRKTRFYEMLSRLRLADGNHIPASRYIGIAMEQDLLPAIDNLMLLHALQFIRNESTHGQNRAYFCNITSLTLNDPKFMGDLVEFIAQNRALAPHMVFEFSQRDLVTMNHETLPVLEGLAQLGCRLSVDQVKSLALDLPFLELRNIRFIKVGVDLILSAMKEAGGLQRLKRLKADLDRYGIDLIVEKIETERQVAETLDAEVDYGQGFLFGHPEAA